MPRVPTDTSDSPKHADGSGIRDLIESMMARASSIQASVELASKRAHDGLPVRSGDEIVVIVVVLVIGGEPSLFILVGADGLINRMGSGLVDNFDRQLFIDIGSPDLFVRLRSQITPGVTHWLGQALEAPHSKGKLCELVVRFGYADGRETATVWRYGSESAGPHQEVRDFVIATLEVTEPWFQQWQTRLRSNKPQSP